MFSTFKLLQLSPLIRASSSTNNSTSSTAVHLLLAVRGGVCTSTSVAAGGPRRTRISSSSSSWRPFSSSLSTRPTNIANLPTDYTGTLVQQTPPPSPPSIAIIGGGIGGLTTACALINNANKNNDSSCCVSMHHGHHHNIKVYEQSAEFVPTAGAGFGLSPNGQVCLASIGIHNFQSKMLHPFRSIARLNKDGTAIVQQTNVLQQIHEKYGFGVGGCLRAELVDLLLQSLQQQQQQQQQDGHEIVQYSHKLIHMQQVAEKVELEFANGHTDVVDFVIGADGIHSFVAKAFNIDPTEPIYSGANIFYGVIDDLLEKDIPWQSPILHDNLSNTVLQGPGTGEFIAFQVGVGSSSKLIWATTYVSSKPPASSNSDEEWDVAPNTKALNDILMQYPSTHPIHEMARYTESHRILHFGLFHRQHKSTWYKGRAVLLGDSCHATLPYVGQGANQAIEDAIVLADCFSKHGLLLSSPLVDPTMAFQEYYNRRYHRTKRVVSMANMMNKLYHSQNWCLQYLVNLLLSQFLKGGLVFQQIEKEIVDECPVKDYAKYQHCDADKK